MSGGDWSNVLTAPFLREWEERQRAPIEAFPTRLDGLNRVCGDDGGRIGLAQGWFVTVGGNPGHGKSLLALNLTWDALTSGHHVAFLTLEMSRYALATRLYSIATGKPVKRLEKGPGFQPGELAEEMQRLWTENRCADLHVNREPLVSVADVLDYLEGARTVGVQIFIVDYIQLVATGDSESVYRQVSEVATELRHFAHRTRSTVIGLSQYNRSTSSDYDRRPTPQSLHGGMPLEANSDVVLLLDHSRYERDPQSPHIARTWLLIGKNRHGPQTEIPVEWDYRNLRIREARPDEEHLWPGEGR